MRRPRLFSRPARSGGSIPIIGFVRFSVLFDQQNFFSQMKGKSPEERREILFDPDRLAQRFRLFEALTLPSLTAQEDQNWRAVVLYSTELPSAFQARLLDGLIAHDAIHPVAVAPHEPLGRVLRREMDAIADKDALRAAFRLDDDDALARSFLSRLRGLLTTYAADQTAVSFARGHILKTEEDGSGFRLAEAVRNFGIGCGLTLITRGRDERDIFQLGPPHRRVDEAFPTIADARAPVFLCTAHPGNDSGTGSLRHAQLERSKTMSADALRDMLGPDFAHLDLDALIDGARA